MQMFQVIRVALAALFSLVGLIGLVMMYSAEINTGQNFENYAIWAVGAGLVFMAIGAAFAVYDRQEDVITTYEDFAEK